MQRMSAAAVAIVRGYCAVYAAETTPRGREGREIVTPRVYVCVCVCLCACLCVCVEKGMLDLRVGSVVHSQRRAEELAAPRQVGPRAPTEAGVVVV